MSKHKSAYPDPSAEGAFPGLEPFVTAAADELGLEVDVNQVATLGPLRRLASQATQALQHAGSDVLGPELLEGCQADLDLLAVAKQAGDQVLAYATAVLQHPAAARHTEAKHTEAKHEEHKHAEHGHHETKAKTHG